MGLGTGTGGRLRGGVGRGWVWMGGVCGDGRGVGRSLCCMFLILRMVVHPGEILKSLEPQT